MFLNIQTKFNIATAINNKVKKLLVYRALGTEKLMLLCLITIF